ncbi:MAG: hypothetical protein AAF637_24150 [Pseudomonadota bacterium]
MLRVMVATVVAIVVTTSSSGESRAACGTLTLSSLAASHEATFNDIDGNGEVSVGDSLIGRRTLSDAAGEPVAELFFVGTVDALDRESGTALRSTKYVYDFSDGTVFGSQDFVLPLEDFRAPPGQALTSHANAVQIIGGTGAYAQARGQVEFILSDRGAGAYRFDFTCDLVGAWVGETIIALQSEGTIVEAPRIHTIVIEEVKGNLIRGFRTWRSPEDKDPGYVGNQPTTDASEPFIGALSSDGDALRLVEIEDSGILLGEILGPDEIEFTYLEAAPHPVVFSAVYRRQQ